MSVAVLALDLPNKQQLMMRGCTMFSCVVVVVADTLHLHCIRVLLHFFFVFEGNKNNI